METTPDTIGRVTIAPQVLITIVHQTTLSTEGVERLADKPPKRSKVKGRRAVAPGVEIVLAEGHVNVAVHIHAVPNANLLQLAKSLQQEIAGAIEHIVGLQVARVDIYVDDISFPASGARQL